MFWSAKQEESNKKVIAMDRKKKIIMNRSGRTFCDKRRRCEHVDGNNEKGCVWGVGVAPGISERSVC